MKLWNYVVMITLLAILLEAGGISSGFSDIFRTIGLNLNNIGKPCLKEATCKVWEFSFSQFLGSLFPVDLKKFSFKSSPEFIKSSLEGIFTVLTGGLALAGLMYRLPIEKVIAIPFITGNVYLYIKIFSGIINYASSFSEWVLFILIGLIVPLGIGFAYSIFEWWTGSD